MIDYVISIYSYGIPLKNSINKENIISFKLLLDTPSSDFSLWWNFHQKLLMMPLGSLGDYFDSDVNNMINNNTSIDKIIDENYLSRATIDKSSGYADKIDNNIFDVVPVFGGLNPPNGTYQKQKYQNINIIHFCWGILFYLFAPTIIDLNVLPKPKELFVENQTGANGITTNKDLNLNDISGTKKNVRLVYLIKIKSGNTYCIKITPPLKNYGSEIKIYAELTNASMQDDVLNDQIVKIYSFGELKRDKQKKIILPGGQGNWYIYSRTPVWIDIVKLMDTFHVDHLFYYLTEYNNMYTPLANLITGINSDQLCILIKNIIKLLVHMNDEYGFIHWDLHLENLLINADDKISIKIYDFDFASTSRFANMTLFEGVGPYLLDVIGHKITSQEFRDIGLVYDVCNICSRIKSEAKAANHICGNKTIKTLLNGVNLDEIYLLMKSRKIGYYPALQIIVKHKYQNGMADQIRNYIRNIKVPYGGKQYIQKYMKYKSKYLDLKYPNHYTVDLRK
jgi:hypothetical protein